MTDFGLAIRNFVGPGEIPDIQGVYAYSERAEALGFESLWAWDHVLLGVEPSFPIVDSITMLGAVAARTRTIKLGTGVLVLPLRNPVVAAKALGSLDLISGGRLILGVAAGWYAREFDAVGVPFKQRGRQFERNLDILMRLWTQDRVTLKVDEFNLREAVMVPRTAQRPRPPVLDRRLRGRGSEARRHGGRRLAHLLLHPGELHQGVGEGEGLRPRGRAATRPRSPPPTSSRSTWDAPARETTADMRQWLSTEWDTAAWSESTIDHAIHGSAAECVEQLRAHVKTGVHRIILIPYRYQPEQVERIAKEVLPKL